MDNYFKRIKDKLKEIKKELKTLLDTYDSELLFCKLLSEKMSAMKTASIYGLGTANFDKEGLKKVLPAYGECTKYPNEIKELVETLKKCDIKIDAPNITIRTSRQYVGGIAESTIANEDVVDILSKMDYKNNPENIGDLFEGFLMGNAENVSENVYRLSKIYNDFYSYVWTMDYYMTNIDALIQAIDNEKIKSPIKDITVLYSTMIMLNVSPDDINKILGKVIAYNANYLKKHPDYQFNHIDLIKELSKYYNEDGTLKPIEDISIFKQLLEELKEKSENYFNMLNQLFNLIRKISKDNNKFENINLDNNTIWDNITDKLINSLKLELSSRRPKEQSNEKTIKPTSKPIDRTFLEYLKRYYKNGEIIAIPEDIELFYQQLSESSLDKQEKN